MRQPFLLGVKVLKFPSRFSFKSESRAMSLYGDLMVTD